MAKQKKLRKTEYSNVLCKKTVQVPCFLSWNDKRKWAKKVTTKDVTISHQCAVKIWRIDKHELPARLTTSESPLWTTRSQEQCIHLSEINILLMVTIADIIEENMWEGWAWRDDESKSTHPHIENPLYCIYKIWWLETWMTASTLFDWYYVLW